jgi:hypothetical protein
LPTDRADALCGALRVFWNVGGKKMQSAPAGLFNTLVAATDKHPPMEWPSPRLWIAFVVVATAASTMSETLKKHANLPLCEFIHLHQNTTRHAQPEHPTCTTLAVACVRDATLRR